MQNATAHTVHDHDLEREPVSFDETVRAALTFCDTLPKSFETHHRQLAELQTRLSGGRLHLAVLGQFNRGKSTFINALLGIKALPASVLPLTSVPTIVEYGAARSCKIKFLDPVDDLVVTGEDAQIANTLRKYVAEENNPHNVHRVRAASITCASELLANGTVIIDTPGFGSTYLHNTETTLNLLAECDAAIFLLSADPPMTQTEVEFLHLIKERVPKIFFVLNKADLLTKQGLAEVDNFIKTILRRDLGFVTDAELFHVSAEFGTRAKTQNANDPQWAASGLEAIKNEAVNFMTRDKYFTLSGALKSKYDDALAQICALIKENIDALTTPVNALRDETAAITGAIQSLSLEMNAELKSCEELRETMDEKIGAWANENAEAYALSMTTALSILLNGKHTPNEAAGIAASMLPKHAADLGAQFTGAAANIANKSIRAVAIRHAEELSRLRKRYAEFFSNTPGVANVEPASVEKLIERFEISAAQAAFFEPPPWDIPLKHFTDLFRSTSVRLETVREFYEPLCAKSVTENIALAKKQSLAAIDAAWDRMRQTIHASYRELIDQLNALYKIKQGHLEEAEAFIKGDLAMWNDRYRTACRIAGDAKK